MYCFDTDVLSATMRRDPPLGLIRKLALVPPAEQFTTAITLGEIIYGAVKRESDELVASVRELRHLGTAVRSLGRRGVRQASGQAGARRSAPRGAGSPYRVDCPGPRPDAGHRKHQALRSRSRSEDRELAPRLGGNGLEQTLEHLRVRRTLRDITAVAAVARRAVVVVEERIGVLRLPGELAQRLNPLAQLVL